MTEHQHQASPAAGGEGASQLKRGLSARHIQMIALGGAIGTGLFMGAGRNIAVAGTSILVIYVLVGFFTYMVMRAMGELLLTRHDYRSFADFVGEYLGPQASLPRLDLLAKLGGDLYRRRSGLRELYAVLVPGTVGVDAGPQHAGDSVPA